MVHPVVCAMCISFKSSICSIAIYHLVSKVPTQVPWRFTTTFYSISAQYLSKYQPAHQLSFFHIIHPIRDHLFRDRCCLVFLLQSRISFNHWVWWFDATRYDVEYCFACACAIYVYIVYIIQYTPRTYSIYRWSFSILSYLSIIGIFLYIIYICIWC